MTPNPLFHPTVLPLREQEYLPDQVYRIVRIQFAVAILHMVWGHLNEPARFRKCECLQGSTVEFSKGGFFLEKTCPLPKVL
jgi:hypothetical protein